MSVGQLQNILLKTEFRLVFFISYVFALVYIAVSGHVWWHFLYVHLFFVLIFGIFYFRGQFLWFLLAPLIAMVVPLENLSLSRYLKQFKQNMPAETVIILGHADWFKLEAWIKPNALKKEIESLVRLLKKKGGAFSFFPCATFADVEEIMSDKSIREVYFLGHGESHFFRLHTDYILYYCDFNDPIYSKEYVHQIHCGTPYGKSLVDYVVPEENKAKCFFFRKPIDSYFIEKELKKRADALKGEAT
jgi:hypothetical protein